MSQVNSTNINTPNWAENLKKLMHILFALTINQCLVEHTESLNFLSSSDMILTVFCESNLIFFLVFSLIVLSYLGYHQSISLFPYQPIGRKLAKICYLRALIDILILVIYAFMVFNTDDPIKILWAITIIYGLYVASGWARIIEWGDNRASKWYFSLLAAIFSYLLFYTTEKGIISSHLAITISLVTVLLFRIIRQYSGYTVKYKIGVDIDGTLAEQVGAAIKFYQSEGKAENMKIEDIDDWHSEINGVDIANFFHNQFTNNPEFALTIEPMKGAIEGMKHLSRKFHLIIITSRPKESKNKTKEWLRNHNIKYHDLRHIEAGEKLKVGFHCLIDDYPTEARRTARKGIPVMLFSRSYNQGLEIDGKYEELFFDKLIIRNQSWDDVVKNLCKKYSIDHPIEETLFEKTLKRLRN